MAYSIDKKTGEITVGGFEQGIAPSPHKGMGNLQGVNIATETGEVMCNFQRVNQIIASVAGTLTRTSTNTVSFSANVQPGTAITVTDTNSIFPTIVTSNPVSALVVAGGGGGGNNIGGGGGAGGFLSSASHTVTQQAYSITIGAGGAGGTSTGGSNGNNSIFDTLTAVGGGGGGVGDPSLGSGQNGGSGGGATSGTGGTGSQGNIGGTGHWNSPSGNYNGGGGGGAGSFGLNGSATGGTGGNGGAGTSNSISGSPVTYAGGGGGGGGNNGSTGGTGGGGAGSTGNNVVGTAGTANTGGGGGGGGSVGNGGAGGSGIVIISAPIGTITATGGTHTTYPAMTPTMDVWTFTTSGTWTVTGFPDIYTGGTKYLYYIGSGQLVQGNTAIAGNGSLPPSNPYSPTVVTTILPGTATYTITYTLGQPIQKTTESYFDTSNNQQYRYYILDSLGSIWCQDTKNPFGANTWFFVDNTGVGTSGLAIFNGWLLVTNSYTTYGKITVLLGSAFTSSFSILLTSNTFYSTLVSHQNFLFYTNGDFVASLQPDNGSAATGNGTNITVNSYAQYTAVTTTGSITALISGASPFAVSSSYRVPAFFYTDGILPSALSAGTAYWISWVDGQFSVYAASTGGAKLDIATGSSGNQYFNTFDPVDAGGFNFLSWSPQALILPSQEISTCLGELSNLIIVGTKSNALYTWGGPGSGVVFQDIIFLPENNTVNMVTVNNMVYVFAGQKGNIYITSGAVASIATSVPDFTAGIAGSIQTYIEPYFTWGDAMYVRGRVWFSVLDQTASKAGNCGGIWSFVPTQNFYQGQDTGLALRLENQSSYGTYNGYSPVLLPSQVQTAIGVQYWSGWVSDINTPTYGIDFSGTVPSTPAIIETDLIPTGTMLDKKTFKQVEYKLAAPLATGESVSISYRLNGTDAYTACTNLSTDNSLSGYFPVNFQETQYVQLKIILTPVASSASSFVRLNQVQIR